MAQPGQNAVPDNLQSPSTAPIASQSDESSVSALGSSASRKRRRDAHQETMLQPDKRRNPKTSTAPSAASFSSATKRQIRDQPESQHCWNCGASPVDMCHVIGKQEKEIADLENDGFLPPDFVQSFDNSIILCPLCHRNFDDLTRPGFVFLPEDLGYFITSAQADLRERQKILDEENRIQRRRIPSQEDYLRHCATGASMAPESLNGGFYKRYTLRDFYPSGVTEALGANPFKDRKTWPGCPYAPIRRGFYALGIRAKNFPAETKADLRRLQDLYDEELKPRRTLRTAETTNDPSTSGGGAEDGDDTGHGDHDRLPTYRGENGGSSSQSGHAHADPGNSQGDNHNATMAVTTSPHQYPNTTSPCGPPQCQATLNRLSQASTLVDAAIKFDRLSTFKHGSNDHVVRMHDYNCRNQLPTDHACRACVIEKYDSLGILYLPTWDDYPNTIEGGNMYPGILSAEEPERWRYGPKATAQEQMEKKMRNEYGEGGQKKEGKVGGEGGRQAILG